MGKEEGQFLKERAEEFLDNARDLIKKKRFNLAAFNLEQAAQLYLKYFLFLKLGDYPKTNFLKDLLDDIGAAYQKEKLLKKFWEENLRLIRHLEDAYLTTRYSPITFEKIEVEQLLAFVEKLILFLGKL